MPRWTPAPIVGGAYKDDARSFSVQDTVNWIPERAESDGTRSDGMLRDAPGAHVVCDLGTNAPVRGLHNCEGRLLAVSGNTLFEVAADYTASSRGSIPGVSRVSIAHNQITGGNEALIANGQSGYVYNTVTEALAQITDESYPGAICVDFLAQVLAQIEPQRRFWFHSDVTQATQYISTDEYEAESAPDLLVALIASHGQLLVLGDRTGEFYAATGGNTSFFQRMEGTTMEVGCASPHAVVRLDSTVFWIGSDGKGYRLNGYNAQRITTHAIEQAWSRCNLKKAFAFTFEDRGHTIAYFTFPDGMTWGYDVATQQWHRRQSKGLNRWRMNALVYWNGHWIGGDYSNGRLYRLDWDHKLECCEPLIRERVSGVLHDNQNDVGVNAAEFVFETGGPASVIGSDTAPSISGYVPPLALGDVVDFQYTITRAYPGQDISLTLNGTLPPGLTLHATGSVTGTVTGAGTFDWTITPAGECATGEPLADSAVVLSDAIVYAAIDSEQYMVRSNDGGLSFSNTADPGDSSSSQTVVLVAGTRIYHWSSLGDARTSTDASSWATVTGLGFANGAGMLKTASEWLAFSIANGVLASSDGIAFSSRVATGAALCPAMLGANIVSIRGAQAINVSSDSGANWSNYTETGFGASNGLTRLFATPTRFLAFGANGSGTQKIAHSTTGASGSWTFAASPAVDQVHAVAQNPATGRIVIVVKGGTTWYSDDDGATWTAGAALTYVRTTAPENANNLIFTNGAFLFGCPNGTSNQIMRSTDGVSAWTAVYTTPPGHGVDALAEFTA